MLNLTPTIDWTKEDIIVEDNQGNPILLNGVSPSQHHMVLKRGVRTQGVYAIEQIGNYLAINMYYLPLPIRSTRQISDSDIEALRNATEYYHVSQVSDESRTQNDDIVVPDARQVRIYKDCKVSVVHHVTFHDGELNYVIKPTQKSSSTLQSLQLNEWVNYPADGDVHSPICTNWQPIIVTTDAQVEKAARRLTKAELSDLYYWLAYKNDAAKQQLFDRAYIGQFADSTRQTLTAFFRPDAPENAQQLKNYADKYYHHDQLIFVQPENLTQWLSCPNKISQTDAKRIEAQQLLQLFKDSQLQTDKTIRWTRSNNKIVAITKNQKTGPMYLFAYDVVSRTRFYASLYGGDWSFGIPSLHMLQNFHLQRVPQYHGEERAYEHVTKIEIEDELTVRELFDGTNIAWILDNAPNLVFYEDNYGCELRTTIQEAISEKTMTQTVLNILATTGSTTLELLLKARLFNMYFVELMDEARAGTTRYRPFRTLEETRANDYTTAVIYNPKASNLQTMFGMTMKQLRVYDEAIGRHQGKDRYSCQLPKLYGLPKVLGINALSELSLDTFKKAVEMSMMRMSGRSYWAGMDDTLTNAMPHLTVEQKLNVLHDYSEELATYRDYLRIRLALKDRVAALAKIGRVIDTAFNEKAYPLRPGKAVRYMRREPNMSTHRFTWHTQTYARHDTDVEWIYGNAETPKEPTGAIVHMDTIGNMRFLHDDVQQWLSFYEDAEKEPCFQAAVDRVKPLEWEDKTTGLKIVAPGHIKDLQTEGSVLSHCVASYVNPIIRGTENVMFIRKISAPDDPFFTVDIVDGNVRQVHCYANGDLTKEGQAKAFQRSGLKVYEEYADVLGFLKKWAAQMHGQINQASLRNAYGALVANKN